MAAKIRHEQKQEKNGMRTTTGSQVIGLDTVLSDIRSRLERMEGKIDGIAAVNNVQDTRLLALEGADNRRAKIFGWIAGVMTSIITVLVTVIVTKLTR